LKLWEIKELKKEKFYIVN